MLTAALALAAIGATPSSLSLAPPARQAIRQGPAVGQGRESFQDTESVRRERSKRRVFRTIGGGILRGKSRALPDGGWQVQLKRGWRDLSAAELESVTLESELLKELAKKKKQGSLAPADLLDWTLDAGLLKEGFQLGDRLLEENPLDAGLREVAVGKVGRFVAGLPERGADDELERLRTVGAQGSALVSEAIVERLLTAAPRAEVLTALRSDQKSGDWRRRTFAMLALGRLFPMEDPRALLLHAVYDPNETARHAAAHAIADAGAEEICKPLVDALGSAQTAIRARAAEALGETRQPIFVEPLMDRLLMASAPRQGGGGGGAGRPPRGYIFVGTQRAYVQDFDVEVAAGSSVADPVVNTLMEGSVLGAGVISVETVTIALEIRVIRKALGQAAGFAPGRGTTREWKKWWDSAESADFRRER